MFTPKVGRGRGGRGGGPGRPSRHTQVPTKLLNTTFNPNYKPPPNPNKKAAVDFVRSAPGEGRKPDGTSQARVLNNEEEEEDLGPCTEYNVIRGSIGHDTDATHIIKFQGREIPVDDISDLQMRRVVDPNYVKRVREVEVVPEKGAGSVYKSSNKVGKVKRRWRPRGEREMLWEMDLEQKSETTRFNGHREKLEQHYMLFVNDGKGNFEVIPTDNWYKFTQEVKYETMSLEEVEAEMKKKKSGDRWVQTRLKAREEKQEEQKAALSTAMSGQTGAQSDSEEEDAINDPLDIVTKHDKKMAKKAAGKRKVEREDMEYEAEFTDDEAGAVTQEALEETEEYEAPPESDSDDEDGEPAEDELTKTGKELRKKLKDGVDDADLPATNADDNADDSDDELGVVIKPTTSKPPPQTQPQPQVRKAPAAPRVKREAAPKAQKRPREEIDDSAKNIPMKRLKPESISPFTEEEVCKLIMSMENASIKDILAKDKKIKRTIGRDKAEKQRFIDIMNKVTKKNETGQTKTYTLKPKFKELYNL